jgi:ABC-type glycerol-3-phosphate transport system substrate-binding protein
VDRMDDLTTMFRNGRIGRREFLNRALALGFSLPAAGVLLAACGGDDDGAPAADTEGAAAAGDQDFEGVTLKFAKAPHGETEIDLFRDWLAPFTEQTGIQIEHTVVPWDQLEAQYTANFAGDDPFDVMYQVSTHLTLFGERGAFEDLSTWIEREDIADARSHIPDAVLQPSIYQDKLYGVPFITGTIVMFINNDILAAAGVDPPTTMDELIEVAQAVKTDDVWGFYTPTTVKDFGWYFNLQNVHNLGGDIVSEDSTQVTINSEPVVQATQYAVDLTCSHEVQPPIGAYDREGGIELFRSGRLALLLDEPLRVTPFQEEGLPFDWTIELPVGASDGTRTTFSTTGHWSMAAESENKEAAWELIKFLSTSEFSLEYNTQFGFIPARDDVDVSGGDELLAKNLEFAQTSWDGLVTHPKIAQILDEYVKALEAATSCGTPVEQALSDAQGRAEEILAQG